jgi:hypothetical protein
MISLLSAVSLSPHADREAGREPSACCWALSGLLLLVAVSSPSVTSSYVLQDWHLQIEEQGPCAETIVVNHNPRALIWDCLSCLQDWHLQIEEQGESRERTLLGMNHRLQRTLHGLSAVCCLVIATCS